MNHAVHAFAMLDLQCGMFGLGLEPPTRSKVDHPLIPSLNKEGTEGWLSKDEAIPLL